MLVESPPAADGDLRQGRSVGPRHGLCLALVSVVVVSGWAWGFRENSIDWPPADRPCAVAIHQGRSVVDLYLSPDVAVNLLISNLGHSNQSSLISVRAEPLSGTPQYRPVPLDSELFASQCSTNPQQREGEAPAEPYRPQELGRLRGSAGATPSPTRDFWLHVTDEPLEDSRGYQLIHGRLVATRDAIQVYVDSSVHESAGRPPLKGLAHEIAERLESTVLPEIGSRLGMVSDVDRDGRLTVLITPWLSRLRGGQTQVRGFVRSSDFRDDIAAPFSNRADVLYLNSDLPSGAGLQTLLLHEVTHAALFSTGAAPKVVDRSAIQRRNHDTINNPVPPLPSKLFKPLEWEDWLNEGLAHLSERSGGGDWSNLDYRIARFWQQPANAPLIVSDYYRSRRWRDHGCRGATFLFLEWCGQRHAAHNNSEFIAAVASSGKPGVEAIERVLGHTFHDLYRAWSVSLAMQQLTHGSPARIGRFGASGPRCLAWNVDLSTKQTLEISGTATRFIELRSSQPGWYRISFDGDPHEPWQVTLVNASTSRPAFDLNAHWDEQSSAGASRLVVSMSTPLPAGWQVDRIACEEIREPHPRVWEWSAEEMSTPQRVGSATWQVPQSIAVLPLGNLEIDSASAVVKVRLKKSTGEIAWIWCDLPPGPTPSNGPTRIAGRHIP